MKDPKGSGVTNATVTVRDVAKGLERPAAATDGRIQRPPAASGTYIVTVDAPGFTKAEDNNVAITVGGMVELPITLTVAGGKEIVEVSSQAELLRPRAVPLPTPSASAASTTCPSTAATTSSSRHRFAGRRDNAPNTGAAPTSGLNMSGQRARSNLVNVDGADATDNSINGVRSTVSQEAVQEFQIITNSYAAEYGRAAGGVVNIITRSGSNDFHGDVYGYLRNRNFQAVNPFSTTSNPAYTRVQGGAAFGGPIKKDKTYYYFSYEVTRRHETGFSASPREFRTFARYTG